MENTVIFFVFKNDKTDISVQQEETKEGSQSGSSNLEKNTYWHLLKLTNYYLSITNYLTRQCKVKETWQIFLSSGSPVLDHFRQWGSTHINTLHYTEWRWAI